MKIFTIVFCVVLFFSCSDEKKEKCTKHEILIPAGRFLMGASYNETEHNQNTVHEVKLDSFWLDKTEVTNAQFAEFVAATGYLTTAEIAPSWEEISKTLPSGTPKPPDSLLVPASLVFYPNPNAYNLTDYSQWWQWVPGANWKHPYGPESSIEGKENHPVVQVSWYDASAYCAWKKKRLPTEAEWEYAARGGLENPIYPWGNTPPEKLGNIANFYQGQFPIHNEGTDGYLKTAPVACFEPNGYGLYDMAGNVWEWCADKYHSDYYKECLARGIVINPNGPEKSFDPLEPGLTKRVTRGGSYLCNQSYCSGYRTTKRMKSSEDTGLEHTGFRCACDIQQLKP